MFRIHLSILSKCYIRLFDDDNNNNNDDNNNNILLFLGCSVTSSTLIVMACSYLFSSHCHCSVILWSLW